MKCNEKFKYNSCARKKQPKETVPEEVKTSDLLDKDFKSSILNMSEELK